MQVNIYRMITQQRASTDWWLIHRERLKTSRLAVAASFSQTLRRVLFSFAAFTFQSGFLVTRVALPILNEQFTRFHWPLYTASDASRTSLKFACIASFALTYFTWQSDGVRIIRVSALSGCFFKFRYVIPCIKGNSKCIMTSNQAITRSMDSKNSKGGFLFRGIQHVMPLLGKHVLESKIELMNRVFIHFWNSCFENGRITLQGRSRSRRLNIWN